MYGLTTIKGMIKRGGRAAFAVAAFVTLAALPARAQAFDPTFTGGVFVGAASGQTVRLRIAATNNQGKLIVGVDDVIVGPGAGAPGGHVKVFSGTDGALLQTYELRSLTAGLYTIDINRDDLAAQGDPRTGRLQFWIEMVLRPAPGVLLHPPTFEVMNTYTGLTTVQGGVVRTWTGTLTLSGGSTNF